MRRSIVVALGAIPLAVIVATGASVAVGAGAAPDGPAAVAIMIGREEATLALADGSAAEGLPWLLPGDDGVELSPDGRHLAFSSARDGNREIYVADAVSGELTRVTRSPGRDDRDPTWSPAGALLAWASGRPGAHDLRLARRDGSGARRVVSRPGDDVEPDWSPDGSRLVFASNVGGRYGLWLAAVDGGAEPEALPGLPGAARSPAWHPSGERLAYTGIVGGNADVWVTSVDGLDARRLVAGRAFEGRARWSTDGGTLGFLRGRGGLSPWAARADGSGARALSTLSATGLELGTAGPQLAPRVDALLPDLDQRPPSELVIRSERGRVWLGFASAVDNIGTGPLRIRGTRPGGSATMRADQLVELGGRGVVVRRTAGTMRYESHPPHRHWHLEPFDRYELRRASDGVLLRRDRKTGFCLLDRWGTAPLPDGRRRGPPRFLGDCASGRRDARSVEQGSSVGYTDRYPQFFHGQEVDVTTVPAGLYVVVHHANPERRMRERTYANNLASVLVRLARPAGRAGAPVVTVLRACDRTAVCPPRP